MKFIENDTNIYHSRKSLKVGVKILLIEFDNFISRLQNICWFMEIPFIHFPSSFSRRSFKTIEIDTHWERLEILYLCFWHLYLFKCYLRITFIFLSLSSFWVEFHSDKIRCHFQYFKLLMIFEVNAFNNTLIWI